MKFYYYFYRIPNYFVVDDLKGKPSDHFLKRYSRGRKTKQKGVIGFGLHALSDVKPLAKGGKVELKVIDDQGQVIIHTKAYCSFQDNFCYKLGKQIALGRAMKKIESK